MHIKSISSGGSCLEQRSMVRKPPVVSFQGETPKVSFDDLVYLCYEMRDKRLDARYKNGSGIKWAGPVEASLTPEVRAHWMCLSASQRLQLLQDAIGICEQRSTDFPRTHELQYARSLATQLFDALPTLNEKEMAYRASVSTILQTEWFICLQDRLLASLDKSELADIEAQLVALTKSEEDVNRTIRQLCRETSLEKALAQRKAKSANVWFALFKIRMQDPARRIETIRDVFKSNLLGKHHIEAWKEALRHPETRGLILGKGPDCVNIAAPEQYEAFCHMTEYFSDQAFVYALRAFRDIAPENKFTVLKYILENAASHTQELEEDTSVCELFKRVLAAIPSLRDGEQLTAYAMALDVCPEFLNLALAT
jgi:hypothetical protein